MRKTALIVRSLRASQNETKRRRLLLADDQAIFVEGLCRILDRPDFEVVRAVNDGPSLVKAAGEVHPDIIISAVALPSLSGIAAARQIRESDSKVKIVFLTTHEDVASAMEALAAGGSGYVLRTSGKDELLTAIREVMDGRIYVTKSLAESVMGRISRSNTWRSPLDNLTPRQREVLQLLAEGLHVKAIASKLNLSSRTVEFHKYRIMNELGLHSSAELGRYAAKHGLVP